MFRDTSEELERLQAELLAEEEPAELPPEETPEEDDLYDEYEDTYPAEEPAFYQNFSNNYGKDLRNYANGYRAYNTDICDEDLEEYSDAVQEGSSSRSGCLLTVTAIIFFLAIIGIVAYVFLYTRGYIG